jgi:O-antigen/teichoic acid export membrane protein
LIENYRLGVIIVMAYAYRPMYFGSNTKIMYVEKTNTLWQITLIAGIISVLLNMILIPIYGYQMAAISVFIGYLYMGYAGFFTKDFKAHNNINFYPLVWMSITIASTFAVYYLVEYSILSKIIISFFALVFATLGVLFVNKLNKAP